MIAKFLKISKQLLPTGRAFKARLDSVMSELFQGLAISEAKTYEDGRSILDSILPDNNNFTVTDAEKWEVRLGLISNPDVSLADRKAAILRKYNHPGDVLARQNYQFLQIQLQLANFDVYVYENIFDDGMGGIKTRNPFTVSGGSGGTTFQMGVPSQMGSIQMGSFYSNFVANFIDDVQDQLFTVTGDFKNTFFIAGITVETFANVDSERKDEFRQLILKLKPAQSIAFLLINYT